MRSTILAFAAAVPMLACATGGAMVVRHPRPSGVIVVNDERAEPAARVLRVPKGHYPPPGECRLWYPGRPPGHQPPPAKCEQLLGHVPRGTFILYREKAWDADYDWAGYGRRHRGAVPEMVIRLSVSIRRD
jgi:hypothetical protein